MSQENANPPNAGDASASSSARRVNWRRRLWKWSLFAIKFLVLIVVLYGLILLVGLIPVNREFQATPGGVKIHLTSDAVHTGLVLPIENEIIDWRAEFPASCFSGNIDDATYVSIGWGDRSFCINTPTWDDMEVGTTVNALFLPSASCMHVVMKRDKDLPEDCRWVEISREQYQQMVDYVKESFRYEEGERIEIPGAAYSDNDVYFEAKGRYHFLNTCNNWVGGALRSAGIKTPWMPSLPGTPLLYLPEAE